MKRIFVDCHVFDGKHQGTRTYIEGLYKELIVEGKYHFILAAVDIQNLEKTFGIRDNITYAKYNFRNGAVRLLFDAPRLIVKHKADAAHFQYRVPPLKLCKYIVTVHDVLFEDFPQYFSKTDRFVNYWTFKLSAKYSEVVLTVSEYSRQKIRQHLGVENVAVTTNGISEEFYRSYDKSEVQDIVGNRFGIKNYIIYISRWEPRKNQDLLLRAFAEMELYKTHHLVFVGGHTFPNKQYDTYFKNLSTEVKEKVTDMGNVSFDEVLLLLRGASLFVYPSAAEGFGIPPLEAIAAGVPTVSSNATSMADFDFIDNYFFNPSNLQEFKDKIIIALQTGNDNVQQEKKSAVRDRYNWKQSAKVFNNAIEGRL